MCRYYVKRRIMNHSLRIKGRKEGIKEGRKKRCPFSILRIWEHAILHANGNGR
jgi:hypothetical protein